MTQPSAQQPATQLAPAIGKQCAEDVHDTYSVGFHLCRTTARNHEDGKDWCIQHTPSLVRERQEKRRERWDAESAKERTKWSRQAAEHAALVGIANPAAVPNVIAALRDTRALLAALLHHRAVVGSAAVAVQAGKRVAEPALAALDSKAAGEAHGG